MTAKVPKKFSARKGPLKSAQNDKELKKHQRNNIINKEKRNSLICLLLKHPQQITNHCWLNQQIPNVYNVSFLGISIHNMVTHDPTRTFYVYVDNAASNWQVKGDDKLSLTLVC